MERQEPTFGRDLSEVGDRQVSYGPPRRPASRSTDQLPWKIGAAVGVGGTGGTAPVQRVRALPGTQGCPGGDPGLLQGDTEAGARVGCGAALDACSHDKACSTWLSLLWWCPAVSGRKHVAADHRPLQSRLLPARRHRGGLLSGDAAERWMPVEGY